MTRSEWMKRLLWIGLVSMVAGQLSITLGNFYFAGGGSLPGDDLRNVLWYLVEFLNRTLIPVGAALFAASFVIRALSPSHPETDTTKVL